MTTHELKVIPPYFDALVSGSKTFDCPELRQAIAYLRGQRDEVLVFETAREDSATRTLEQIRRLLASALSVPPVPEEAP